MVFLTMAGAGCGGDHNGGAFVPLKLSNFQAAAVVVGQPDFTHGDANQGGSAAANTINSPFGDPAIGSLFLSDYGNNRVLGFNSVPGSNNASADFVLGQPDFATTTSGDAANEMNGPETVVESGGKLIVNEFDNHRVLIWNSVPSTTQVPADVVVGQPGFPSSVGACSQAGLGGTESVAVGGDKLIVADSENDRVLIWNAIPTANGTPADLVLGQNNFTTCVANNDGSGSSGSVSASNLDYPSGVWSDGTRLVVVDSDNSRVLIWKTFPTSNFQAADIVLGQNSFTCNVPENDGTCSSGAGPSAKSMAFPYIGVFSNGIQLFVADGPVNNRILVWNAFPTANFQAANVVLGQNDFTCNVSDNDGTCASGTPSAKNLLFPNGLYQSGNQLFVSDEGNNRFLVYNGH